MKKIIIYIISMLLISNYASAQLSGVFVDIGPCLAMEIESERYACYDDLESRINASTSMETKLPVISIPRGAKASQDHDPEEITNTVTNDAKSDQMESFGLESTQAADNLAATARVLDAGNGSLELVDTVTELDQRMPNKWTITLSNGQVWQQVNSSIYRLRKGMEIKVFPSPFGGSFRLSATNVNGFIQVQRVQ